MARIDTHCSWNELKIRQPPNGDGSTPAARKAYRTDRADGRAGRVERSATRVPVTTRPIHLSRITRSGDTHLRDLTYSGAVSTAFWVCSIITALSAFVGLGYSIATVGWSPAPQQVPAMYAFARSLALAAAAVAALLTRSVAFAEAIAFTMIIVQAADAVIGVRLHERMRTFGPAATSLANAIALVWLMQQ